MARLRSRMPGPGISVERDLTDAARRGKWCPGLRLARRRAGYQDRRGAVSLAGYQAAQPGRRRAGEQAGSRADSPKSTAASAPGGCY
jgi:hypothetical protein